MSTQTAKEMAIGAAKAANANVALATTGIAGPDGGTIEKPVGLVYISCYVNDVTVVEEHIFAGERSQVRNMAVEAALQLAEQMIENLMIETI